MTSDGRLRHCSCLHCFLECELVSHSSVRPQLYTPGVARSAVLVAAAALLLACMAGVEAASTPTSKFIPVHVRAYVNTKLRGTYLKGANATKGFVLDFPSLPANVK